MRKGYSSTHASYHLPLQTFVAKVRKGINIAQGVGDDNKVISVPLDKDLSEISIKRIFDDADCVCYHGGIEMIIPKHLA